MKRNRITILTLLAPLAMLILPWATAQQTPPKVAGSDIWEKLLKQSGTAPAKDKVKIPGLDDMSRKSSGPKQWDGVPVIVEEDLYDPPKSYFGSAKYYRILTPIAFKATKGDDYKVPSESGNAANDYCNMLTGFPSSGSMSNFVAATDRSYCDFAAAGKISDPFGYQYNIVNYYSIRAHMGMQYVSLGARVREEGTAVRRDLYHRWLTMADHIDSHHMNLHWAWIAYDIRKNACDSLINYYHNKGNFTLEQKYRRFKNKSAPYYRTLRKRYTELSRSFVEGNIESFREYILHGPNREIQKELIIVSTYMLNVARGDATAKATREYGNTPGWPSLRVLRYCRIHPIHYEPIRSALTELMDDPEKDKVLRECAKWALDSDTAELQAEMNKARNDAVKLQEDYDPRETGM
jgi:hypothetical protein